MTPLAKLNFHIARLRYQMRGIQSDIRLLSNAGLDCAAAAARLARMQSELLALIDDREVLSCPAEDRRRTPNAEAPMRQHVG